MKNRNFKFQLSLVLLSVLVYCVSACAQNSNGKFTVHGKAAKDIQQIVVVNYNTNKLVDTLQVVDGNFEFVTEKTGDDVFYAFLINGNGVSVVSDADAIELDLTTGKIKGSPLNEKLSELSENEDSVFKAYTLLKKEYDSKQSKEEKDAVVEKMSHLEEDFTGVIVKMIDENQDNCLPALLLLRTYQSIDFKKLDAYTKSGAVYTKHPLFNYVKQYVEYKRPFFEMIGKKFTDVEAADFEGKSHKLSEYVGKGNYVLVDFWASWCGPCMREMPNIKKCWEQYKSKGFNVVGISLDNDSEKWKNAVAAGGYNWVHISDLGGWQSSAAKAYNVQSIPWNILCDGNGVIVGVALTGRELYSKLASIFK